MSYHEVEVVGYLGRDPELRYTPTGTPVLNMSVAVSDGVDKNTGKKRTIWVDVTVWDAQAESCNQYLSKRSQVLVKGRLIYNPDTGQPRTFVRKDGTVGVKFEITASFVRFLDRKGSGPDDRQTEYGYDEEDGEDNTPF